MIQYPKLQRGLPKSFAGVTIHRNVRGNVYAYMRRYMVPGLDRQIRKRKRRNKFNAVPVGGATMVVIYVCIAVETGVSPGAA